MSAPEPEAVEPVDEGEWCCQEAEDAGWGDDDEEARAVAEQAIEEESDGAEQI